MPMDRKRKSVFAGHQDDTITTAGVKKNRPQDFNSNTRSSSPHSCLLDTSGSQNDIQILQNILAKYATNPEHGALKLSTDVLKAATDLSRALQHTPPLKQPPAGRTGIVAPVPPKSSQSYTRSLPLLPPILDNKLGKAVLIHPGMRNDQRTTYDRLEILGDAYIELIATKLIWNRFQEIPSGRISQIRELLVKNETLADYATQYGLDSKAIVPLDYMKQPKRWTKTKGDIFEAYVAAVILSHPNGYSIAEEWLAQLWSPKLETIEEPHPSPQAKEALAKKIMGKGIKLKYIDEKPALQHQGGTQTFFIGVYLTGWGWNNKHLGSGQGLNKTFAGNQAAQQALQNEDLINAIVKSRNTHGTGNP
ncbi:ribonuclease III domain-containing protein [Aspergillus cavernicola]|uniref:Ribonuclease III domain-containing protein n=1 Tax=Aspergillus cavernicola TaxID=176166 RepID=A0ABR4H7D3_9EURO